MMKLKPMQAMGKTAAVLLGLAAGPLWAGTEGASSTFYGQGAGTSGSGSSGGNTFIGTNAGYYTAGGTSNTFVGLAAGDSNTIGSANTYLGMDAGYNSTTGGQNTFIGYGAGYTTNSSSNTFIGTNAGYSTTTGGGNTFIGTDAGYNSTTGSGNAFIGHSAGYNNNGTFNTFLGTSAGYSNTSGYSNTFIGGYAGLANTIGEHNTFVGQDAGQANTTGIYNAILGANAGYHTTTGNSNTIIGETAGYNSTGTGNVFLGFEAGFSETGSNRLYIDNCYASGTCDSPLIYGEFDNHLLRINGVTHVASNSAAKSQMHFSLDNGDYGGFLTSVLPNNFFISSGARFDSGNWVQLSSDGNAVMSGSGGQGYRIFTHTGGTVGNTFNNPTLRLHIDYSGQFGINIAPVAGHEIHTSSGAYLAGGTWTDASSRAYKHDIHELPAAAAADALAALNPVTFRYNDDEQQQHVGFIAEDVPELVAMKDRKGLAPMDIVAVLTKVVQEQRQELREQDQRLQAERARGDSMEERLRQLASDIARMQAGVQREDLRANR